MEILKNKKIAIVYDWMDKWGGVERLLITLSNLFPQAVFFTAHYDLEKATWAKKLRIESSFMQKLPNFIKKRRILSLLFYPYAFESFDFSSYDLVISVTSSFAKGIITKPGTFHLCYLLTPPRFLWTNPKIYLKNFFNNFLVKFFLLKFRNFDFITAQRPDKIISISETVALRCKRYYRKDTEVIYPPFNLSYWRKTRKRINEPAIMAELIDWSKEMPENYFLVVSRFEPYKRVDLAIKVFNQYPNQSLIIVGSGSLEKKLKRLSKKNIFFLDKIDDQRLAFLYSQAKALIMPQEEDFGYTSLEAQFFGCPVVAYQKGGGTETVIDRVTGIFFKQQTQTSLIKALERFHINSYNLKRNVRKMAVNVQRFSKDKFRERMMSLIKSINY